jgi:hypothetical protein
MIALSIVAYRDRVEMLETLGSLFENAADPSRVHAFVFAQDGYAEIAAARLAVLRMQSRGHRVSLMTTHYLNARGPLWARQRLFSNFFEIFSNTYKYYFQIDSHMRVIPGWDVLLVNNYNSIYATKKLVTHYPPAALGAQKVPALSGSRSVVIGGARVPKCVSETSFTTQEIRTGCMPSRHIAAGFMFCSMEHAMQRFPLDPVYEFVFQGEELVLDDAFFDFQKHPPAENVASHAYGREAAPKVWNDVPDWPIRNAAALSALLSARRR